jgi:KaiC/GvpD/RAD55 family RecA-like ATPase/archaellum biogenesis ATPase FlaH
MNRLEIANTGIPLLDSLLGGGFLSNSVIVISYQPGSKMLPLVFQLVLNKFDEKVHLINVAFSLQNSIDRLKVTMQKSEFLEKGMEILTSDRTSNIYCFNIPIDEEDSKRGNAYYVSNPFNVDNLLSVMSKVRESVPEGKRVRWAFYSLTDMSVGVPEEELIKFCRRAFRYHKQQGDLAIYLMNEKAHSETFFAKVYQLSDVFIKLIAEETSWGTTNGVQVVKGVLPFQSKKVFYDVSENRELQFITDKQESKPQTTTDFVFSSKGTLESGKAGWEDSRLIRTGIHELDSLLGGGILSNSVIVGSYQYGVRIVEPLTQIFQNQLGEKTHLILVTYNYSSLELEARLKMWEQMSEIHRGPAQSLLYGNLSFIDCFSTPSETHNQKSNINYVSNPFDVDKLLSVMANVRSSIPQDKSVFWMFSSLTDMSIGIPEEEVLKFCRRAFQYHKRCGDLAAYTLNEKAHSEIFRAKLYQLADIYIRFIGEDTPEGIDTSIQVTKGIFSWDSKKTRYLLDENGNMQFVENL